ncbi:MAG: site-2 protease family protein [Patescibacteria group bacterium]
MDFAIGTLLPIGIAVAALLISLTVHEFSHALVAYLQGDETAYQAGRLTLNPIAHIDPMGTIFLPGLLLIAGSPVMFGWAKPVPFNPLNLRNVRTGPLLVGLAGPLSNILMCVVFAIALKFALGVYDPSNYLILFFANLMVMNFVLGVFNLIPIPPLDGSRILTTLLPNHLMYIADFLEQYGNYIIIFLLIINATVYPFFGIFLEKGIGLITQVLDIPL